MSFEDEFKKRLRRVCGVTDDTTDVSYELGSDEGWGGCDTCGYDNSDRSYVDVTVRGGTFKIYENKEFEDLGALMRAMDGVEL